MSPFRSNIAITVMQVCEGVWPRPASIVSMIIYTPFETIGVKLIPQYITGVVQDIITQGHIHFSKYTFCKNNIQSLCIHVPISSHEMFYIQVNFIDKPLLIFLFPISSFLWSAVGDVDQSMELSSCHGDQVTNKYTGTLIYGWTVICLSALNDWPLSWWHEAIANKVKITLNFRGQQAKWFSEVQLMRLALGLHLSEKKMRHTSVLLFQVFLSRWRIASRS